MAKVAIIQSTVALPRAAKSPKPIDATAEAIKCNKRQQPRAGGARPGHEAHKRNRGQRPPAGRDASNGSDPPPDELVPDTPKFVDPTDESDVAPDELVPDPVVRREFNISAMTLWRWDQDPELIALGLPLPVTIRNRKFRFRRKLETFKQRLLHQAISRRDRGEK